MLYQQLWEIWEFFGDRHAPALEPMSQSYAVDMLDEAVDAGTKFIYVN